MADFTKEMKKTHTILLPDIFPVHMKLIKEIFHMYGYKADVLTYRGKNIIDTGLKYTHNDMCYPAICMSGQQIHAILSGDYPKDKVALMQFQSGGGCRATNYLMLLRKALINAGYSDVPVISLSFSNMEKYSGFKVTPMMMIKAMVALVYGDILLLLKNQVKPYEINKGDSDSLVTKWVKELTYKFSKNKGLGFRSLKKNLNEIAKSFSEIKVEKKDLIKVGIVGEIYVKYSSFGNNGLEEFLDTQNVEYMIPGVLAFFEYSFSNAIVDNKYYGSSKKAMNMSKLFLLLASKWEKELANAVSKYNFVCPSKFSHLETLADKVIDRGVKMGEGWLLPAEVCELIESGYDNVICVQPFGCLPNHIVGKGVTRRLRELYPNSNIFPVDYDAGASKVNQENRIKLMLEIARENKSKKEK